jgi:hypothetical protein
MPFFNGRRRLLYVDVGVPYLPQSAKHVSNGRYSKCEVVDLGFLALDRVAADCCKDGDNGHSGSDLFYQRSWCSDVGSLRSRDC